MERRDKTVHPEKLYSPKLWVYKGMWLLGTKKVALN